MLYNWISTSELHEQSSCFASWVAIQELIEITYHRLQVPSRQQFGDPLPAIELTNSFNEEFH